MTNRSKSRFASDKCPIEWKATKLSLSLSFLKAFWSIFRTTRLGGQNIRGTFRIVRSIRAVRAHELNPGARLLRACSDRLIVHNWQGIKRAKSRSKIETLRSETWSFDERNTGARRVASNDSTDSHDFFCLSTTILSCLFDTSHVKPQREGEFFFVFGTVL